MPGGDRLEMVERPLVRNEQATDRPRTADDSWPSAGVFSVTATVACQNTDRDLDGPLPAGRKMIRSGISWLDVEDTGGPKRPPVAPGA